MGAAAASLVSTLGFTIVFWSSVRRRFGIRTDVLSAAIAKRATGRPAVL
jgi:hypothetical protein